MAVAWPKNTNAANIDFNMTRLDRAERYYDLVGSQNRSKVKVEYRTLILIEK
jgi:hypothetical protein